MLVAFAVLVLIMAMLIVLTGSTGRLWRNTTARIEAFQNARAAYQTLTLRLSQATLNTYLDYYDAGGNVLTSANSASFVPVAYGRNSDLHFICGPAAQLLPDQDAATHPGDAVFFQAPLGYVSGADALPDALNACGYYVDFNTDQTSLPAFLNGLVPPRWRYRLVEFLQPAESLAIYTMPAAGGFPADAQWFRSFLPPNLAFDQAPLHVLAENVIVLVVLPQLSSLDHGAELAPAYGYDSRAGARPATVDAVQPAAQHQLPPLLRVVMVCLDETSALRLGPPGASTPPPLVAEALNGRFQVAGELDNDLAALTAQLDGGKVTYHVFDTLIAIRGAKWSP